MTTRPMLHEEVTSIMFPGLKTPAIMGKSTQEAVAKKGHVMRVEAFLDQNEALTRAHQWRKRATATTWTARVYPRTMKADGLWLRMYVLVVREKVNPA